MHLLKRILFGLPIAIGLSASSFAVAAQDQNNPNIEVLAKGPVHEGFASGIEQSPAAGPIAPKAPPDQIEELPPDQKPEGENVVWIPGYWSWDDERKDFIWVSGFWRVTPPNRTWVPGNWRRTEAGYQWTSGFWNVIAQQQAPVQYFQAPPAPLDVGPTIPAPVETSVYVPGNWMWRSHWAWRPGTWIDFRPGYIWIPAHYQWTPAGYIFIDGYWDYALADRGILFAPVYYRTAIYTRPSYYYTPSIWVRDDCLFRAMFVRRGHGSYYFGDYFGEPYAARGFTAWISAGNVSVGFGHSRNFYDPNYSYYRIAHRSDPYWRNVLADSYVSRHNNPALRPPTTLIQQNVVINNINNTNVNNTTVNNTTINNANRGAQIQNMTMLSNIRDPKQAPQMKLTTVSDASRQDSARVSRQIQDIGRNRATEESHLVMTPMKNGTHDIQLAIPQPVALKTSAVAVPQPAQIQQSPTAPKAALSTNPKTDPAKTVPPPIPQPSVQPKTAPAPMPTPAPAPAVQPKTNPAPIPQPLPQPSVQPKTAPAPAPMPAPQPKPALTPIPAPVPSPIVSPKAPAIPAPAPAPVAPPRIVPAPAPVPQPAPAPVAPPRIVPAPQPVPQPVAPPRVMPVPPPQPAPAPPPPPRIMPAPAPIPHPPAAAAPKSAKDSDPKDGKK